MNTRFTTAATLIAASLLALTACGSPDAPAPAASTTAPAPTGQAEDQGQECTNEVYAQISAGTDLGVDSARPDACTSMSADEYADTLLAVTQVLNQNGRDDLDQQIEDAASAATE